MKIFPIILLIPFFFSCKNTNSGETAKHTVSEDNILVIDTIVNDVTLELLYTSVDQLRLRKEPGSNTEVAALLEEGTTLIYLNEKTNYTEKIKIREQWYEQPWLKVKTESEETGWVYGGAVQKSPPKLDITKTPYDDCNADYVKNRNDEAKADCYKKVIKEQLEKDAKYIKKTNTGYQVTLLSGETRNLVDNNDQDTIENFRQYEYRYYLKKMGYFVFKIYRLEADDYMLMDDKFGYAVPIYGMPKISPDFKKLVIHNPGSPSGFDYNGIQLLSFGDEGFNTLFLEEFDDFTAHNPIWIDDKNISFDILSSASVPKKSMVKAILSEDVDGIWNLTINNR